MGDRDPELQVQQAPNRQTRSKPRPAAI